MASGKSDLKDILGEIRWPLLLTRWGMVAERLVRAFWPLWSILIVGLALLMLGVQDTVAVEWVWGIGAVLGLGALWALVRGARQFRWPTRDGALLRLDGTLRGNPIQATMDRQAIGAGDAASLAVWKAHQERMRARLREARAVEPDLRVSRADPFALRYAALLMLSVAILFGSLMRVQSVTGMGAGGPDLTQGPSWEGWMAPPGYTRMPSIYLNDIIAGSLEVPEGAQITLRMYGEVGALVVDETVSGRPLPEEAAQATAQDFEVVRSGQLAIDGPGGRVWDIAMIPDIAPTVVREGEIEVSYEGEAQIPFAASDDHGIEAGTAVFTLSLEDVDRRYGRRMAPEARPALEVPLPMPISGSRAEFTQSLVENFSLHPWANLPVRLELSVSDARGQKGLSEPQVLTLPGRRFFDPVAAALIEQRQALLWNRDNARDISMILRAVSNKPGSLFRKEVLYLRLRTLLQRIEVSARYGLSDEAQAEIAQAMWDLALELEEGDLDDARERLKRAQERLAEAMKNGASDQEIAELMQELREATQDYMRQLAQEQRRQAEQNPDMAQQDPQNMIEMSQDDIQRMMDRIQELMEEGRMDEAMEAMRQLQEMLENMQITEGQGQGGQSPGEQAMEGLSETLRDQQELSDEAFRDLQEQFNRGEGQEGQQQGQQEGQQGQQQPGQQQGEGQGQQQPGQQQGQGQEQGQGQNGQSLEQSLADRQRALRDELNRQRRNLPGQGTEGGESAAEALGRAEGAMDGAEEALRDGDLAEAIDQQSEAMEALREGLRNLGEALAQQQQQNQGQQGFAEGGQPQEQRDPLGRDPGNSGQVGSDEGLLQGEDVYRRAQELLDELRQRSGDAERPRAELDYLERLLDRF
ncbi:TIGR02302 family protein [Tropicibacter oceani]|uniref:TIGR02302 family protein n=1 Tax=Tropicibacter oceani TaxID=3058420 RepID=A0ABY8QJ89_9RHOB|nr:TIGR02302 family protein [Tropicibacter oceani]WGW04702.1 TIGR02302 family protein [Tropicibacter oceani]